MEPVKERTLEGFGHRLRELRMGRGLTQIELGKKVGVSNRVVAYYEDENAQPPGPMLADLARTLRVSVDQLLGLKSVKETLSPKTARLINRLRRIEQLSPADQRALLRFLDALLLRYGNGSERSRRARARSG